MTNEQKIATMDLLRSGLGVEDIELRVGASVEDIRAFVKRLRRNGDLLGVLKVNSHRNHSALQIMGVVK